MLLGVTALVEAALLVHKHQINAYKYLDNSLQMNKYGGRERG